MAAGLETWPDETVLVNLRLSAVKARDIQKRHRHVSDVAIAVKQLVLQKRFDEALTVVSSALQAFPGDAELDELMAFVQSEETDQQKRDAIQHAIAEARSLLTSNRLEEAATLLNDITSRYPGEVELEVIAARVNQRLKQREKAAAIHEFLTGASRLRATDDFDAAIQLIQQGLAIYKSDVSLIREFRALQAARLEWQRNQAICEVVTRADLQIVEGQFDGALRELSAALGNLELNLHCLQLRGRLEEKQGEQTRREGVTKAVAAASQLIDSGKLDEASILLCTAGETFQTSSRSLV